MLFDHERLEVYCVAREFFEFATELLKRKIPHEQRKQIRKQVTNEKYRHARWLLVRVSQMRSKLCGNPRTT